MAEYPPLPIYSLLDTERLSGISLSIARTTEELAEVKTFDDQVFGGHQLIELEELQHVAENGLVLVLKDTKGILAESQFLLSSIPEHPNLAEDEAYVYGIAVRQDTQNKGIASTLHQIHERVASMTGKRRITLTVRVENASSIRSFMRQGYGITGYDPNHYGAFEEGGARLLMEKDLQFPLPPWEITDEPESIKDGRLPILPRKISDLYYFQVGIPVQVGDTVDLQAHKCVEDVLRRGYEGTGLLKPEEYGGERSVFIFTQK